MPVKNGKLKPDDEKRLRANYPYLLEELDGMHFIAELYSKLVFTRDDMEEVSHQPSRGKRTQVMLDKLLHSGPGEAYNVFYEILERDYDHVAKKLRETTIDTVDEHTKSDDWFESIPDEVKNSIITDADASRISSCFDANWRHVIARLGVPDNVIEQEKQNSQHGGVTILITSLLIKWRQRVYKNATIGNLLSVLKEVDQSGACSINWEILHQALSKH